jgi:hypothetical protein
MLEAREEAGLLRGIKGKARDLIIGDVEIAVQGMLPWPENELNAFNRLAEVRSLRKLVAHFAVRRFLNDSRDWLKHSHDQEPRDIINYEALVMLWRALTKYYENFGEESSSV